MQVLKPTHKKHRALNNKRLTEPDFCECGCGEFGYLVSHEVYYGSLYRQISIDNGFQKRILDKCHKNIHECRNGMYEVNRQWQREFQAEYISKCGRENWFKLMGKFYD